MNEKVCSEAGREAISDERIEEIHESLVKDGCFDVVEFARAVLASGASVQEPIPMILHCPKCGTQHIDAPEDREIDKGTHIDVIPTWTNPPHRSHLCHKCGTVWRPADIATTGVAEIATKGSADNYAAPVPRQAEALTDRGAFSLFLSLGADSTEEGIGKFARALLAASTPATAAGAMDEREALEAAYNAGWDASDACDNAYNNGTSEQLAVPGQSHEPEVFQRWRAEWFSNRNEVIDKLLARAASSSPAADSHAAAPAIPASDSDVRRKALTDEEVEDVMRLVECYGDYRWAHCIGGRGYDAKKAIEMRDRIRALLREAGSR